jgi:hypothetical protein
VNPINALSRIGSNAGYPTGDAQRRDLQLLVLGATMALKGKERDKILARLPSGSFLNEIEPLMEAIRTKAPKELANWLGRRGVLTNGNLIDACVSKIAEVAKREAMQNLIEELQFASKLETTEVLHDRLKKFLETLDESREESRGAVSNEGKEEREQPRLLRKGDDRGEGVQAERLEEPERKGSVPVPDSRCSRGGQKQHTAGSK